MIEFTRIIVCMVWMCISIKKIESTCSLPTAWDGTWYDSYRGDVVFDHNNGQITSGWRVDSYTSTVTAFTCVTEDTDYFLFKGDTFVKLFSNDYNAFLCMRYTKITDYSYYYYIMADEEANANNERAYVELYDPSKTVFPIATYCTPSTNPSTEEFHVLVKSGYESSIKQWFPEPLLGNFYYTYNDGSTTTCGTGSVWDNCSNRTETAMNLTQCSSNVLFSTSGLLYSTIYLESSSTYFVSLLNTDSSISNPTNYRYTCLAVTWSGSTVYVSTNPGDCVAGQTSTAKTTDGGTAVLTPYSFTTPTTTTVASASIIPIIAAVVAVLFILGLLILACCLYKKYKKKKEESKVQSSDDEKKMSEKEKNGRLKEDSDMIVEPMTARDALSVDLPDDDDRGLIPLSDAPRPAPPSTPMSQAIRSQIRDIPQDQPSLPPITRHECLRNNYKDWLARNEDNVSEWAT